MYQFESAVDALVRPITRAPGYGPELMHWLAMQHRVFLATPSLSEHPDACCPEPRTLRVAPGAQRRVIARGLFGVRFA